MPSIYLLRHAEAVPHKDPRYRHDADRPLTEEGTERMRRAAEGMKSLDLYFDRILTSPFVRARETAQIVAEVLGAKDRLLVEEALASGARWDKVKKALAAGPAKDTETVLLVGHEPDLSRMTGDLIEAPRAAIVFKKGTLARVAVDAIPPKEPGALAFLLSIDQMAAME